MEYKVEMKKKRLDELVLEQGLAETIEMARSLIMAGKIRSGDRVWEKAGEKICCDVELERKDQPCRWVSRGGLKLEQAFSTFVLSAQGCNCLDIGASTGGFTHVLLESGAARVVALDVGYGLLDQRVARDARVVVKDRTNFRQAEISDLGGPFDLIVTDVSFISLRLILPRAYEMLQSHGKVVALIKPQFEAPRGMVPEGGVITDAGTHFMVVNDLVEFMIHETKLSLVGLAPVPLVSRKKNIEFVSLWEQNSQGISQSQIKKIIADAHCR